MPNNQSFPKNQDLAPTPDELFEAAIVAEKHIRTTRFRKIVRHIVADAMEREGADLRKLWLQAMAIFEPAKPHDCDGSKVPLHFDDAADICLALVESGLSLDEGAGIVASVIGQLFLVDFIDNASPEVVAEEMRCEMGDRHA